MTTGAPDTGRPWRILVVDDDPDFLQAARRVLSHAPDFPTEISLAADPAEARRRIQEEAPDVVLSDYRMPPELGSELLREVARDHPKLKRVILTGFPEMAQRAGSGAELILNKNDLLIDLERRLRVFLESNRAPEDPAAPSA